MYYSTVELNFFDRLAGLFGVRTERAIGAEAMASAQKEFILLVVVLDNQPVDLLLVHADKTNKEEIHRKYYGGDDRVKFRLGGPLEPYLQIGFRREHAVPKELEAASR